MIYKLKFLFDKIGIFLSILGTTVLLFIMMYTVISVALRFFTGKPLLGTMELGAILLPVAASLFYTYTDMLERHIRATIIFERFNPKLQLSLNVFYEVLTSIIFAIVGWRVSIYGYKCMQMGSETSVLGLPTYPFHFIYSLVLFLFAIYLVIKSIYNLLLVKNKNVN